MYVGHNVCKVHLPFPLSHTKTGTFKGVLVPEEGVLGKKIPPMSLLYMYIKPFGL